MFTDALKKRFESIPDASPKEAEAVYWKQPTIQMGSALKLAFQMSSGAPMEDNVDKLSDAVAAAAEMERAIARLCLETGVDPNQNLEDAIDSVVALVKAANDQDGEMSDDTESVESDSTIEEVGAVTG